VSKPRALLCSLHCQIWSKSYPRFSEKFDAVRRAERQRLRLREFGGAMTSQKQGRCPKQHTHHLTERAPRRRLFPTNFLYGMAGSSARWFVSQNKLFCHSICAGHLERFLPITMIYDKRKTRHSLRGQLSVNWAGRTLRICFYERVRPSPDPIPQIEWFTSMSWCIISRGYTTIPLPSKGDF
jgi:hypothetical protein